MLDLRPYAHALWGEAGALAYGFSMAILAFRTPGAAPGTRGKALMDLALGVFVNPVAAEVFTTGILAWVPRLDPKAVSLTLGMIAVPAIPRFAQWAQNKLFNKLGDGK